MIHVDMVEGSIHKHVCKVQRFESLQFRGQVTDTLHTWKVQCSGSCILQRPRVRFVQLEGIDTLHALKVRCSRSYIYVGCRGSDTLHTWKVSAWSFFYLASQSFDSLNAWKILRSSPCKHIYHKSQVLLKRLRVQYPMHHNTSGFKLQYTYFKNWGFHILREQFEVWVLQTL